MRTQTQARGPQLTVQASPSSFSFGGQLFPTELLTKHTLYLGATGSGKTVSIQLLLPILCEIGKSSATGVFPLPDGGKRALIYDAKRDTLTTLAALGVTAPVILANPFDKRSSFWQMCLDITSPAAAYEMSCILFPGNPNSNQPFFDNAAQNLGSGVLKVLHLLSPNNWTFRHFCLILRSAQHLRELLSQSVHTRHLVERYLDVTIDSKLTQSILATIDSKLEPYLIVAALWDKASSSFTLRDFIDNESILVVGSYEEGREAIDSVNRVLLHRLTQLLLGQPNSDTRRTYLVLDEVREAGKLSGLSSTLLRGRSKGVCVIAGAQDKEGLVEVYGEHVANELLGQFGFRAVLKLESPTTAAWAASSFGSTEVVDTLSNSSRTFGGERPNFSQGTSQSIRERAGLLPGQILNLPPTNAEEGLHGFYKTPFGSFPAHIDFMSLLPPSACGPLPDDYNFQPRDDQDQYLDDWRPGELDRFNLTPLNSPSPIAPGGTNPTTPTAANVGANAATSASPLPNIRQQSHPFAGGGVTPVI